MIFDANLLASAIFLFTSIPILSIGLFFYIKPTTHFERLKQIISHLFFVWGAHFLVVGGTIGCDFFVETRCMQPETMRMLSASFVFIEFIIMIQLYSYIKHHD